MYESTSDNRLPLFCVKECSKANKPYQLLRIIKQASITPQVLITEQLFKASWSRFMYKEFLRT
jgi:hypothetical protein